MKKENFDRAKEIEKEIDSILSHDNGGFFNEEQPSVTPGYSCLCLRIGSKSSVYDKFIRVNSLPKSIRETVEDELLMCYDRIHTRSGNTSKNWKKNLNNFNK